GHAAVRPGQHRRRFSTLAFPDHCEPGWRAWKRRGTLQPVKAPKVRRNEMAKVAATSHPQGSKGKLQESESLRGLRESLKRLQENIRHLAAQTERDTELADRLAGELAERPKVKVVLYPDGTGGYTVVAKALPGCIAEGDTREEALAEFREALRG